MPSRPQANPNDLPLAALQAAGRLATWATGHPGMSFLLLLGGAAVLYHLGILEPLDWWGTGMEVR